MEIKEFQEYKDGGTIEITTDEGVFCFDHRIGSTTKGRLYNGMPKDDNSNLIENSCALEARILKSLKFFRDDFYQPSIDRLVNSKQE